MAAVLLAIAACTKDGNTTINNGNTTINNYGVTSSSDTDTTFNGSYLQLTIGDRYFMEKDAVINGIHVVVLTTTTDTQTLRNGVFAHLLNITLTDGAYAYAYPYYLYGGEIYQNIYGLTSVQLNSIGSGTGNYQMSNENIDNGGSYIYQFNPQENYSDTTGTETITHNDSDYISGTINTTVYSSAGFSYPVTGSFKIYH
jgi:hypothetical protein